jgi:hypothetical protein
MPTLAATERPAECADEAPVGREVEDAEGIPTEGEVGVAAGTLVEEVGDGAPWQKNWPPILPAADICRNGEQSIYSELWI